MILRTMLQRFHSGLGRYVEAHTAARLASTRRPADDRNGEGAEQLCGRGWHRFEGFGDEDNEPEGDATAPFTGFYTQHGARHRRRH